MDLIKTHLNERVFDINLGLNGEDSIVIAKISTKSGQMIIKKPFHLLAISRILNQNLTEDSQSSFHKDARLALSTCHFGDAEKTYENIEMQQINSSHQSESKCMCKGVGMVPS